MSRHPHVKFFYCFMKAPFSWLKEYLDIPLSAIEVAEVLNLAGMEVDEVQQLQDDAIFDISLTPNLGHALSIRGLARALGALINQPLKEIAFSFEERGEPIEQQIHVSLVDKAACGRYACRLFKGVRVGPSPEWLQKRLTACGLRSINNVVDVGNLVMLEHGQPLHMFDYDQIAEKRILITAHTEHSDLETLDGVKRAIPPDSLLIADPKKALAFAGVMGGSSSAVTEQTTNLLIESAYFTPQAIRKSSKHLNLKSDASHRFERGVDPNGVVSALDYAVYLLIQVAGGQSAKGCIDIQAHPFYPKKIACRIARVNSLLGTVLSLREASQMFSRLGMRVEERETELIVAVPTFRSDIAIEEDLIEEIALLYGYNNIPKSRALHAASTLIHTPAYLFGMKMRRRLIAEGLQEFLCCDLISPEQSDGMSEVSINVLHAKSLEQSVLRTSLLPGLMQSIRYNRDHYQNDIAAFELGRIYFKQNDNFQEESAMGVILTGKRAPYHWALKPEEVDFFDLKGIIENVLTSFNIGFTCEPSHLPQFHPQRQAYIVVDGATVGALGEVHPSLAEKWGVEARCYFAECNLHELFLRACERKEVIDAPLYPGSERDATLCLPDALCVQRVFEVIDSVGSSLLQNVVLLDLYKSEQIGKDKKNVTFRFFYRDPERTLSFETVEKEHAHMIQAVAERLK
jgi:phenylalanyl-tRNA synthetase beta chain